MWEKRFFFSIYTIDQEDNPEELSVVITSDRDGVLLEQSPNTLGFSEVYIPEMTVGEHVVSIIVTDSMGIASSQEINIRINTPPDEPILSLSPLSPLTNQNVIPNITAIDQDGDVLAFSYQWKNHGLQTPYQGSFVSSVPVLSHEVTTAGDVWSLEITPFDGFIEGPTVSAFVEIQKFSSSDLFFVY